VGGLNRESLLNANNCLEEELFRGERLIWRAEETELRQKVERINDVYNKIIMNFCNI
jgi:hypothetical protein